MLVSLNRLFTCSMFLQLFSVQFYLRYAKNMFYNIFSVYNTLFILMIKLFKILLSPKLYSQKLQMRLNE